MVCVQFVKSGKCALAKEELIRYMQMLRRFI